MKNTEEIFELLKAKFGDDNISLISEEPSEDVVLVSASKLKDIALFLKDESELKFDSLVLLSGVDDNNGKTVKDEEGNSSIEGHTLSVYYHLESLKLKHKLILKVSVPIETPEIESLESVWKVADWHEREAFDLFGIKFLNHPNLIRILLPYDWEGYPLRKDYKNPEFYQGMKIPYE